MARAPISVIIPTLNAAAELPGCLASLTEGLGEGLIRELLISDGGSTDATRKIAEEAGAIWLAGEASRGGQLRRGCAKAQGEWVLVLHADSQLPEGWTDAVLAHLGQAPERAGYFDLSFRAKGLMPAMVAAWANQRSRRFGLPYGDQGLLLSRRLYDQCGGYPDIPLMEDVAIARALRRRLMPLGCALVTSATRYQRDGWLRRGTRNLITLARYLLGADPAALRKGYDT